jgi:hypothetical protein
VRHILIILSFLLLSSFLISCVPLMAYLLTKETYVGERENGKYHGQGTLTFRDGRKYVGEWKDGKRNGQGTVTSPDGYKYVGEFKNGKNHGQGTLTFPDGIKFVGEFREDKPWNTTGFNKDGNIFGKYVNGVEQ